MNNTPCLYPYNLAAEVVNNPNSDNTKEFVTYSVHLQNRNKQLEDENRELKRLVEIQKQEIKFLQDNEYNLTGYQHK